MVCEMRNVTTLEWDDNDLYLMVNGKVKRHIGRVARQQFSDSEIWDVQVRGIGRQSFPEQMTARQTLEDYAKE
jgi:hypothetical protein